MSSFEAAINFVLNNEGGFIDHPSDPGGATNYGVSLRTLRHLEGGNFDKWDLDYDGDIDADDMRLMTRELAIQFYEDHFWHPLYEKFEHQAVATKVLDMVVNMGSRQGIKILQRACNWNMPMVRVDGYIGPKTLAAANSMGETLEYFLPAEQAKFYFELVDDRTARQVFLLGWLRRAYRRATPPDVQRDGGRLE